MTMLFYYASACSVKYSDELFLNKVALVVYMVG